MFGESFMEIFELRFLDRYNTLVLVRRFAARDIASAMAEAQSASGRHALEVWNEKRLVGRVERAPSRRAVSW